MDEVPTSVGLYDPRVPQDPQMLGHRPRRDVEQGGQCPNAKRLFRKQADDLKP